MTTAPGSEPPLDGIAAAAAQDAGIDADLLADFLPVMVAAVAAGSRLGRRDLATYLDAGRKAAARGVALRALLDLYLSAAWRLWGHLPQVSDPAKDPSAVARAGQLMLRSADDVATAAPVRLSA